MSQVCTRLASSCKPRQGRRICLCIASCDILAPWCNNVSHLNRHNMLVPVHLAPATSATPLFTLVLLQYSEQTVLVVCCNIARYSGKHGHLYVRHVMWVSHYVQCTLQLVIVSLLPANFAHGFTNVLQSCRVLMSAMSL